MLVLDARGVPIELAPLEPRKVLNETVAIIWVLDGEMRPCLLWDCCQNGAMQGGEGVDGVCQFM